VSLHTHEWGTHGDVPVVFWHALGEGQSGEAFGDVARVLAGAGFHVVAVDGPGFGTTPTAPLEAYAPPALAERLHDVLDELAIDRPVLAGHSWGGTVALAYAAAHPDDVRALVLFDSGHLDYVDVEDVDVDALPDDATGRAMRGMLARVSDYWPVVEEHRIPVLAFLATEGRHGETNRAQVARFEAAVPHAEIRWPAGATHGIVEDVGPPLADEIAAWLTDQGL
jgi:pimeloyl-ACP methyl ester carboxylesterase